MARMRRSTSATSASEAPDLSTMIMIRVLSIPSSRGTKKAAGASPAAWDRLGRGLVPPAAALRARSRRWATSVEEVRDDVLREARDQIEDEADDRALGLQDEVHRRPVVLAQPRADQRLAPLAPHPEAEERADRETDGGVDHAPQRAEERAADGPG